MKSRRLSRARSIPAPSCAALHPNAWLLNEWVLPTVSFREVSQKLTFTSFQLRGSPGPGVDRQ